MSGPRRICADSADGSEVPSVRPRTTRTSERNASGNGRRRSADGGGAAGLGELDPGLAGREQDGGAVVGGERGGVVLGGPVPVAVDHPAVGVDERLAAADGERLG